MDSLINKTFVSGNTFAPTHSTVIAVCTWIQLTDKQRQSERKICRLSSTELANQLYVVAKRPGFTSCLSLNVFLATHYESNETMIAAYASRADHHSAPNHDELVTVQCEQHPGL